MASFTHSMMYGTSLYDALFQNFAVRGPKKPNVKHPNPPTDKEKCSLWGVEMRTLSVYSTSVWRTLGKIKKL